MATPGDRFRGELRRLASSAVVAIGAVLSMAACTTDTGGINSMAAAPENSVVLESMAAVTEYTGPNEPFTPTADKHIMILVCGNVGLGCVRTGAAAKEAAEAMGWTADVVDGRLDPTVWNRAVKQAVDSGADGIVSIGANPNLMGEAMAAVQAKNIPFVVTSQSPQDGDIPGVRSFIRPDPGKGGSDVAQWIIGDSGGQATVLILDSPEYADIMMRNNSLVENLGRECAGCAVRRVNISAQTMGTTLAPTVTSQLQQYPDTTYVWSPDDAYSNFVAQGIQQAGKATSVKLVSGAGAPEGLARVLTGQQAADLATPDSYLGWLAVDSLARAISGVPVAVVVDVPQRFFTTTNIGDAADEITDLGWDMEFDYQPVFTQMWGVQ